MAPGTAAHANASRPARDRVELILSQLDQLPTLPAVAARLLAVTTDDDSSVRDVVDLIESDASLTSALLRMVRRAELGVRAQTITVGRAVTLLGFRAVRNLVLTVRLFETFPEPSDSQRAARNRTGLWLHSLAVACTAEMLGERLGGRGLAGEAFVCGLLHDIGKIALDACLPKGFARVVDRVEREFACICDVERDVFGLDHTVAGRRLATRWQLPPAVVESAWLHHQSPDALTSTVTCPTHVRLIHLADNVVRNDRIGFSGYQHVADIRQTAADLGIDPADVDHIRNELPQRMEPFRELLGLDETRSRAEYTASLEQANRQLANTNARLTDENRRFAADNLVLAAIERFMTTLGEVDGPADVCAAAAESIRAALNLPRTVVCFIEAGRRTAHLAESNADETSGHRQPALIDLGDGNAPRELLRALRERGHDGFVPVPPRLLTLGNPDAASYPEKQMLPFTVADQAAGAIIAFGHPDTFARLRPATNRWTALAHAVALAMRSARTRDTADRMNEELLDVNRRLRDAQQQLVRTRSISMIAAMAAGAAHELNNPLSVISGRAQMRLPDQADEETARTLQVIVEQAQRASQIVSELMQFAKPEPPKPRTTTLADLLQPIRQHWQAASHLHDDQLRLDLTDPDATVCADPDQIRAAIDALIANAVEATNPDNALIQINSPSHLSDDPVRIVIEDNGTGMSREVLEHALDPFFSYRPAGRGRGLGLSRAYRFIEINGGRLLLTSSPGAGTRATIELPARNRA